LIKENKRKLLHYRVASFLKPVGQTLQALIEQALAKVTPATERFQDFGRDSDPEAGWLRFINTHKSALGMEFGALVMYAPGQHRHTIEVADGVDELPIEQVAPDEDGRRQFLESMLFYGVKGNHVVLLQSMALRARDLENYLKWLLMKAGLMGDDNSVFLNNYAPENTRKSLTSGDVKSVRIGTPLIDAAVRVQDTTQAKSQRTKLWGEGLDVLKSIMSGRLAELNFDELGAAKDLEVFVEVTYKRSASEPDQKALNRLATAFRHVGDDDIRVELKGGSVLTGTDLQIKGYRSVATYNGLVDPSDLFTQMHNWLLEELDQGSIDAEATDP
jgi:hypothetical protein